jgi:ATP-dependent helicase/nuclease subunit A
MGFDDLLRGARDLLTHHPDVRQELKARFGAVLVDEFQDTDPLQGEMILFLSEQAESRASQWKDVILAVGKLFIVGDPKQSIYRFRGADIRAYEAFVSLVVNQGGRKCDLQTSFRTHERIVEPVNRLFSDLMQEDPGLQAAYLPLLPRPGGSDGGEVELALVENGGEHGGEETVSVSSAQTAEARWIARWIVDHCGPEGAGRPWRLGDVALLFRSSSPLTTYMEALKAAKIPYLVESDRTFFGTPEVMDFLNVLRVIDDPGDRVSMLGLLRSPLVLLEDRDLMALAAAGALDFRRDPPPGLPEGARNRLRVFYDRLARLRAAARGDTLPEAAARILGETLLLPSAAAFYHGEQSVANLLKVGRLAAEAHRDRGDTLGAFARRLSEAVGRGVEEGESPLGEERVDAVRLSTIHKAKGLEYKVVLLPNLAASVQNGDRRPVALRRDWSEGKVGRRFIERQCPDAAMAFLEADEIQREEREAIRLFYVAATRAREHVVLVGQEKPARGSFLDMLKSASRPVEKGWELKDGLVIPVRAIEPGDAAARPVPPRPPAGRRKATAAHGRAWSERRAAPGAGGPALFATPSSRTADDPSKNFSGERPGGPTPAEAALLGRLCHAVLERGPLAPLELTARVDGAVRRLRAEYPDAYWSVIAGEAEGILDGFLRGDTATLVERVPLAPSQKSLSVVPATALAEVPRGSGLRPALFCS